MSPDSNRRRIPRRSYRAPVGVLSRGILGMGRAFEMGEGGMLLTSPDVLRPGMQVIVNFYLKETLVIVRAVVRNVNQPAGIAAERYGVEFQNLSFLFRREIRNFVASQGLAVSSEPAQQKLS